MDSLTPDVFALPPRMDAASLPEAYAEISRRRGADLDLEGSHVDRIGAQGLQLVISAFTTWREDGFRLRVVDPSTAVTTVFEQLGCADQLADQEELAA